MKRLLLVALAPWIGCSLEPAIPGASVEILEPGSIRADLASIVTDGADLQGLARDPRNGHLQVLVERRGVLELDAEGILVAERKIGVRGLQDKPYRDVAVLDDGRMLFIADSEGYLWDEASQRFTVHFCVEPGFIECTDENGVLVDTNANGLCDWDECIDAGSLIDQNGDAICDWEQCMASDGTVSPRDADGRCAGEPRPEPSPEPTPEPKPEPEPVPAPVPLVQKNDALTLFGTLIVAAPRFYDDVTQVEAGLRTYDANSGRPLGGANMSGLGLDLTGIAPAGAELIGVSGTELVRLDMDGRLLGIGKMDVSEAAGVIVVGDEALVLDRASMRVVAYPLDGVR
jgi:hypothetical protein